MTYELTFKRVDGTTEKVETSKFAKMTDSLRSQIAKANLDAGKGELLDVVDVTPTPVKKSNKPSRPTLCPHCDTYCYGDCQSN
jgi:hypothetical protein